MGVRFHIVYEATADELVDVHQRILDRSRFSIGQRLWTASVAGLAAAEGAYLWLAWRQEYQPIFIGGGASLLLGFLLAMIPGIQRHRRINRRYLESFGLSVKDYRCEVSIEDGWISSTGNGVRTSYDLSGLRDLRSDRGFLQLDFQSGQILTVPVSGFRDSEEKRQFEELIRSGGKDHVKHKSLE